MLAACCLTAQAQRMMEDLNRGLVAVQTEKGVFTSWRIHGTEYYDTQYNLYRDGKLVNPEPLDVSNFTDPEGTASSTYTVKAVTGRRTRCLRTCRSVGQTVSDNPHGQDVFPARNGHHVGLLPK